MSTLKLWNTNADNFYYEMEYNLLKHWWLCHFKNCSKIFSDLSNIFNIRFNYHKFKKKRIILNNFNRKISITLLFYFYFIVH
jgi:hypothetical protein